MGTLKQFSLGLVLIGTGFGQSATSFNAGGPSPKHDLPQAVAVEVKAEAVAAVPTTASEAAAIASRYVAPEEMEAYLISMTSVFSAMKREKDPFGQYQDPDSKPKVQVAASGVTRPAPTKETPLTEIVGRLPITTIMPGEQSFLIGTRKVQLGQEVPLVWRGKTLRVKVTEVTSRLIAFRNVESGETGARTMDLMPVGMSIGNGSAEITAPGMVPDSPNAPIELESPEISP